MAHDIAARRSRASQPSPQAHPTLLCRIWPFWPFS